MAAEPTPAVTAAQHPRLTHALLDLPSNSHYGSLMDIGEVIQQLQTRPVSTSSPSQERPVTPASPVDSSSGVAKPVPPPKPPRSNHNSMRFQSTPVLTESMVMSSTEPVAESAAPFSSGFHFSSQQNLNSVSLDIPMIQTFGLQDQGFSFSSPSHKDEAADSPEGRHQHHHGLHNPDRVAPTTTTATQDSAAQSATSYYGSVLFTDPLVVEAQSVAPTVEAPSVAPTEEAVVTEPVEAPLPVETEPVAAVVTPAASEAVELAAEHSAVETTESHATALPAEEPVVVSATVEPAAEEAVVAAAEVHAAVAEEPIPVEERVSSEAAPSVPSIEVASTAVAEPPVGEETELVDAASSDTTAPVVVDVPPVQDEPIEIVGEAHFITSSAPAVETPAAELPSAEEETFSAFIADPIPPEDVTVAPSSHDEFFPSETSYAPVAAEAAPLDAEFEPSLSYYNFDTGVADDEAFEVVGTVAAAHEAVTGDGFSAFCDTPVPPIEPSVAAVDEGETDVAAAPVIVQILAPPQSAPVILPTSAVAAAAAGSSLASEPQSPDETDVVSAATTVEAVAEEAGFHEFEEAAAEEIPADEGHTTATAVVAEATAVPADWDEEHHVEATATFTLPAEVSATAAVAAAEATSSAPTAATALAMDTRSSRSSSGSAATTTTGMTAISMPPAAAATSAAALSSPTPLYLVPPSSAATSAISSAASFDRNHPPHYESLEHMPTITIEASSVFVDPPVAATAHGAADSPLSSASSNSSAPLSGAHGSLHRRQQLSYRIEAQRNGKLRAIVSLKQPHLKRSETSPQGNRPDEIILGDCATDAIARDLCECYAPPVWMSKQTVGQGNVCTLCQVSFSMFSQPHHCRNCGYLICGQCSDKIWPGSMLPETFHDDEPHKMVRVCHACHCLADLFVVALCQGDYQTVRALYASGNINLHQPYSVYAHHAYPVHYAVLGGNLDILRWLMDVKRCSSVNVTQKVPLATQTGWTLLGLAAYCGHVEMIHYLVHQKRCSVTEIKDVVTLQRAMHALLKLPGPMPEFNASNKTIPQSVVTVQALQDELLRMVTLHRPRSNVASAPANGAVAHAAVASAARHELDSAAIAEALESPTTSSGHAVYGTAIHNNNSYIPSATAQEAPIIVSNRIEAAPVQINALGILTQTTTTPNMFSKATLTRPLPKNRFLCPQAVFRVQEFLELQRRSMFYTLPPSLNHNGTVTASAAVPTATATSTVRASGSNSDVVALASLVNSAAMTTALASPVQPAVATASATPVGGGSEHSSHRSGRNGSSQSSSQRSGAGHSSTHQSTQSSARHAGTGHGHGHHVRR